MVNLQRIIFHWTAGAGTPNATDLEHYHFIIDRTGKVYTGKCEPKDNINCNDGKYAAHTGGGNTGSIGISFCGMAGFNGSNIATTKYPLTKVQMEAGFKLAAELCKNYGLNLSDPMTIQTHYGFGKRHPKTTSSGKIDIIWVPYKWGKDDIEKEIYNKVKWYRSKI